MAEKSGFFNSISHDRKYKAEDWAAYFAAFVGNGIVLRTSAALSVYADGGSMSVTLGTGSALINGYRYENTAELSITLPTAHASLNRYDAIMIRWNRSLRAINAYVVSGTASASPVAEAPARTADIYELCVAVVYVAAGSTSVMQSAITDKRLDSSVCGIATMIGDLDTTSLYNQVQAALNEFKTESQADFAQFSATQQAAFAAWFAGVRETLGGDVAGNLLNLINAHAPVSLSVSLPASGWTGSGPYTQTVSAAGMLATDTPLADVTLSDVVETAKAQLEAYALVGRIDTGADAVTVTCYDGVPAADLTVNLKVVR